MRITGGDLRGRVLGSLSGRNIRPTSSKVRQAVFNIIGNDLSEMNIIDIYAGTGIMGLEALSRGGAWALFIDNSGKSVNLIKKNLELCGFSSKGYILKKDLKEGIPDHGKLKQDFFDLAFIDPPYGQDLIPPVLDSIAKREIMADDSYIVAESLKQDHLPEEFGDFKLIKTRLYGETKIDVFKKEM